MLYLMSALYIVAGIYHFVNPKMYVRIMPAYIPAHYAMVYLSGFLEMLFGGMLLFEETRRIGAWGIIAVLIAVFPANIQMSINYYKKRRKYFLWTLLRLPLQGLLIWWAWLYV